MSLAEFINKIVATMPGVVFEEIGLFEGFLECSVTYAHHRYSVEYDTDMKDRWTVSEYRTGNALGTTAFSRRIEGLLSGCKRNDAGQLVPIA